MPMEHASGEKLGARTAGEGWKPGRSDPGHSRVVPVCYKTQTQDGSSVHRITSLALFPTPAILHL